MQQVTSDGECKVDNECARCLPPVPGIPLTLLAPGTPVAPVAPQSPVEPTIPLTPVAPVAPVAPVGPKHNRKHQLSKFLLETIVARDGWVIHTDPAKGGCG